jgi:hypothetical protein
MRCEKETLVRRLTVITISYCDHNTNFGHVGRFSPTTSLRRTGLRIPLWAVASL